MNIIEEAKVIVFSPPRMGTRSISGFFSHSLAKEGEKYNFKYGYCEDHPNPYVFHHWTPTSLYYYKFPRPELLKKDLDLLLNSKYDDYQWLATVRHPVSRYKSIFNWWLSGSDPELGVKLYNDPREINRIFNDYIILNEISKLRDITWIRTEHIAEDMLKVKLDIDKYPKFVSNYEKYFLKNRFTKQMECKIDFEIKGRQMKDELEFDINLLEEKHIDYCYNKYRFVYEKHGYEKYPETYNPSALETTNKVQHKVPPQTI